MGTSGNQRTRLTTRLFHESLLSLLKQKSIDKITVKELCEGAGLNRTTFYLHYGKPDDVLREIEDELIQKTQVYLDGLKDENAASRLQSLLEYIRDDREMFQAIMGERGTDTFRFRFFEGVFPDKVMAEPMKQNAALKSYTEGYLVGGAFAAIYTWILNDCVVPSTQLADLIYGLSRNAIAFFQP